MTVGAPRSFGAHLKALREAAGFRQEEIATIAGLSVHAVSALERGERRRPHVETVRALSAALDLTGPTRDALLASARAPAHATSIGVVFVPLVAIRESAFVASAIAKALGLANVTALDLPKRARVACQDHPTLLALDDFEQVLDTAPLVMDLLASVTAIRVLAPGGDA